MNNNTMFFSKNRSDVEVAFRDYMNHYLAETEKREGVMYDKTISFSDKEKKMNNVMLGEIGRLSNINFGENGISKEMWSAHPIVKWASFAVVNNLIDMIIPDVLDRSIGIYTESRYIGMGDSASFTVEPNDLFYVSKTGRNQRTVEFQRQYEGQVTIVPENRAITVNVNFYRVLAGMDSLARFAMKAVLSLEAQITRDVYSAFSTAMTALPTTPANRELQITGWNSEDAISIAQKVTAFNNGSKAVFLGTALALRNILPSNANYRYTFESDYMKLGYVRNAFGFDTMVMPQIADWKNPYALSLDDTKIFVVSPASQKLVKLVYEGASRTNSNNAYESADLTETTTINKSYGIGIGTNAIAGLINISN